MTNRMRYRGWISGTLYANTVLTFVFVIVMGFFAASLARAQTLTVLHTFGGGTDGAMPYAGLTRDAAGILYGVTEIGGSANQGTVFKLDGHGKETVLHSFGATNGQLPLSSLIRDAAGNLYGTIFGGGSSGYGAVYTLDKHGKENALYSFSGKADGANPYAALLRDAKGNFYGTTYIGGAGVGVVFKLDKAGKQTVLHTFTEGGDGRFPYASLIRDHEGNLYSTTLDGGPNDAGTVFKLDQRSNETILYSFTRGAPAGSYPFAELIRDAAGNLYGTTFMGGTGCDGVGCGVVFKLDTKGEETVLHSFKGSDGANPYAGLIRDSNGNFYGTTLDGGSYNAGVVYKLNKNGKETVLYNFTGGSDGAYPYATLVRDATGNLYGTTWEGGDLTCNNPNGPYGCGVVFKLAPQ
jgi:uncharacterized repeat protein (TIGR03803 family)